jgi:HEAT repeat protein
MQHKKLFVVMLIGLISVSTIYAQTTAEKYYNNVLDAGFYSEKMDYGKAMGKLQTDDAKKWLLKLMEHKSYWERSAAIWGLVQYRDKETPQILIDAMLDDHMVCSVVENAIAENVNYYTPFVIDNYYATVDKSKKKTLLGTISKSKSPKVEKFYKKLVADKSSEHRVSAFISLSQNFAPGNYDYIKGFLTDKSLRPIALQHIVKHGTKSELPIFIKAVNNAPDPQTVIVGFTGISKWADIETKKKFYLDGLNSEDSDIIYGALAAFPKVHSLTIMNRLCTLVDKGDRQSIRFEAADQLIKYNSKKTIPYLILPLKEAYYSASYRKSPFLKGFLGVISMGIIPILDGVSERYSQRRFSDRKYSFAKALKNLTGQNFGSSYSQWRDWAIYEGYTVSGENIIQRLFSGDPDERKKARNSSVRLLGYRNLKQFKTKNPDYADKNDTEIALGLAKLLIDEGILTDWK